MKGLNQTYKNIGKTINFLSNEFEPDQRFGGFLTAEQLASELLLFHKYIREEFLGPTDQELIEGLDKMLEHWTDQDKNDFIFQKMFSWLGRNANKIEAIEFMKDPTQMHYMEAIKNHTKIVRDEAQEDS